MNIIYMHTHDSGRYWSPYGHALPTPNIMAFAKQATLFRQAYCAGPTCSPSRAGLLTGRSAHACGMQGLAHLGWQLNDYSQHLASFLTSQGYHTALCGIQHEAPDAAMLGYSTILQGPAFSMADEALEVDMVAVDRGNTDTACEFLRGQSGAKQPFFLSLGLFSTHREFPHADGSVDPDYLAVPPPLYNCAVTRQEMADYHASVRVADDCFGQLLQTVEEAGLREDTMVIMTTDHGIAFPKMKCTLYDTGIGVALIIRLPKRYGQVKATDALVSHLDVFPTICEVAGLGKPNWLEGTSLLPLLTGETDRVRQEIFSEVTYHAAYEPKRCIRTDRYKLIRRYDTHNDIVPVNIDDCTSKDLLLEHGYLNGRAGREALYDLWLDPGEWDNLAQRPDYREVYNDLSARLENWMQETDDPLLCHGARVPKPAGAKVIKREEISARSTNYEG